MKVKTRIGRKIALSGPNRAAIIKRIKIEFEYLYQWSDQFHKKAINAEYSDRAFAYMHRAEALIELLEEHDCGSVGGYDGDTDGLYSLEERFALLKEKR